MSNPRVSVVMSVYNGARFLRPAVDSILSQTLDDFEFIVVDDGSTDETAKILEEYVDPRIILLRNEKNLGLAHSLNRGIAIARSDFIARQDADDVSHPDRFKKLIANLDQYPNLGVIASAVEWIDAESQSFKVWPQGLSNRAIQQLLLRTCPLIHGSTIFRRRSFEEVGGYDGQLSRAQDYDLWLRVSEIWDLRCLPEVLYQYRRHEDMASIKFESEQSEHARASLMRALKRRNSFLRKIWSNSEDRVVGKTRQQGRRWLACRYVWWAQGARGLGIRSWARFLLSSILLDPANPELWRYVRDILARKISLKSSTTQ